MSKSSEYENKQEPPPTLQQLQQQQQPQHQLQPTLVENSRSVYGGFIYPENEFGAAFDRCCTDVIIKGFCGTFIGAMVSVLLFRRRPWPIYMGVGFGLGLAYRGCEKYIEAIKEDKI